MHFMANCCPCLKHYLSFKMICKESSAGSSFSKENIIFSQNLKSKYNKIYRILKCALNLQFICIKKRANRALNMVLFKMLWC